MHTKQTFAFFFAAFFLCCWSLPAAHAEALHWLTSYEEGVNQSKASGKPMILFFTGSDWCSWCHKLDNEVLNTPEFAQEVGNKFIFVRVDFPINSTLPPQEVAQNKQLQKKFDIKGFPTIVILDRSQQQVGVTGYRPGGGKAYASHLFKLVNDYTSYRNKMQTIEKQNYSSTELHRLYDKAKELGQETDAHRILKMGMLSKDNHFFVIERYRFLVEEGRIHDQETIALRKSILENDPQNESQAHYRIALIDFEDCCQRMEKEQLPPQLAIAPLVSYINKFGDQDKQNLWRLQMIISQVYLEQNQLSDALKFAQDSYHAAPSSAQAEIATAIKGIKSHLSKN